MVYKWKVDNDVLKQGYLRRTCNKGLRHPKLRQISPSQVSHEHSKGLTRKTNTRTRVHMDRDCRSREDTKHSLATRSTLGGRHSSQRMNRDARLPDRIAHPNYSRILQLQEGRENPKHTHTKDPTESLWLTLAIGFSTCLSIYQFIYLHVLSIRLLFLDWIV